VTSIASRMARAAIAVAALSLVAGCSLLPRSGPTRGQIFDGSVLREGDSFVLVVDDRVNAIASVAPALGFTSDFLNAGVLGSDVIAPGDTLGLTIWENVAEGLLVPQGQNATILDEVQVGGDGFIFVPYAGRVRAAGNTPERVREIITERLGDQTPDPQVQVRRLAGDGTTVSVVGAVGAPGIYAIERPTRTLSQMLARAGGTPVAADIARVTVTRGSHTGQVWFEDVYAPHNDIALRGGDKILVEADTRSFTALGATGAQSRVPFETQTISAIEAIAQVGGLNPNLADPTGVFVLRNEPEDIAEALVGEDLTGTQRVIYLLDLTRPNGLFFARDFAIRDGDLVYVTEAPIVQLNKAVGALTGTLNSVGAVTQLGAGN